MSEGWGHLPQETPTDDEAQAMADASTFAMHVAERAHTLRVTDAAHQIVAAEKAAANPAPPFDAGTLAELLARPAPPPPRVDGLIPADASTLISAQRKTGKTTLELNLARALLTGEPFLGVHPVTKVTGCVGLLNYEVSAHQIARWADETGVPADRLYVVNLRGRRNPFTHPDDLTDLATRLRAHDVETLMVDPFGRAYTGRSQNDAGEVGAWLTDLDRFARGEAGATDLVLTAHAGWDGERTRGSSALEDWADVIITMTRDDEGERYLRAEGRDVLIEEDRLTYDDTTRTLTRTGTGSRRTTATNRGLDELVEIVVEYVYAEPGITGYKIDAALKRDGHPHRKGTGIRVADRAVDQGLIDRSTGARNAWTYFPRATPTPTVTTSPTSPDLPPGR